MTKHVKPCPFCGYPEVYDDHETMEIMGRRTGHAFAIACRNCEVVAGGADTVEEAFANWNTRAGEKQLVIKPDLGDVMKLINGMADQVSHLNTIAATIRINALRHGATDAQVEDFITGKSDFVAWMMAKIEIALKR